MASHQAQLHRSKSATSVKERRKNPLQATPQDPDASRAHALIAAHRAMDRTRSRSSTALQRTDSAASRRSNGTSQRVQFSPATQLRKQRSVLQSKAPHLAAALQVPQEPRLGYTYTESDLTEFEPIIENYGAEPSSYRRIRRTKSLLTPRRRFFSPPSPQIPRNRGPTLRKSTSTTHMDIDGASEPGFGLRIRKSFNFLRPSSRIDTPARAETVPGSYGDATVLPRGHYLHCMPQPTPERKPSTIAEKFRLPRVNLRRAVRSHASTDPPGSIDSEVALSEATLPKRGFSGSLRNRFLKVFNKSASSRKSSMPPQQLDATRRHFSVEHDDLEHSLSFDDYHVDEDDVCRQSFYVPPLDDEPDHFSSTLEALNSGESLRSNSRSRVTSWSNSTSTTASTARQGGLQQNRLSIIKEDAGPHQPSSSAGRHIGGINVFQDPLPETDENGRPLPMVDSQRIYSALMKRIGEEEAEIEHTGAALQEIHQNRANSYDGSEADLAFSTIRAVSKSTHHSSDQDEDNDENDNHDRAREPLLPGDRSGTGIQHQANVERRRELLVEQQQQQSFFPFSSQYKRSTPSPFRKMLDDRKSQDRLRSIDDAEERAPVVVPTGRDKTTRPSRRAALSSESLYSVTTNGGENEDYVPPIGSIDDLRYSGPGMATIISAPDTDGEEPSKLPASASSSEPSDSKASKHVREHAQIDPDDVGLDADKTIRPLPKAGNMKRYPLLDLQDGPMRSTPVPKRSSSLTKTQSGLPKRNSVTTLKDGKSDESRKASSGLRKVSSDLRKISPGNIARMLRERKSQLMLLKDDDSGKENKPSTSSDSPPMSTPGRLGLQMRSGNGRLRKRPSDVASGVRDSSANTITPGREKKLNFDNESPTIKVSLSARLSRPFNMDVPESNRPFDSMYLGKGEMNSSASGNRLSVAASSSLRGPGGYGGLGGNAFDGENDTALPDMALSQQATNEAGDKGAFHGLWNSKRIVSDFLKRRRTRVFSSDERGREESPAFV
ncbi:uncharacterized protein AB675_6053 [Cyphellophora attinorum]|uniref:Uncharacterized protein n=1 Tax=Cyphellophora attinorum TaxID=1664694 RepID=A0A0N1H4G5_9EURO|nr:uncharacterized protein AB675_6053 [Phialophora attinorum]KPI36924.1 hypothetical protein AB675_6053 [Phialophora attinorum]